MPFQQFQETNTPGVIKRLNDMFRELYQAVGKMAGYLPLTGGSVTGNVTVSADSGRVIFQRPSGKTGQYAGIRATDDTTIKGALFWDFTNNKWVVSVDGGATMLDILNVTAHALTAWAPTLSGITIGNGTVIARYRQINKEVYFEFQLTFGSTTAVTGQVSFTLPVNIARRHLVYGDALDYGTTDYQLSGDLNGATCIIRAVNAAGTYLVPYTTLSASIPHTWAVNDVINICGTYESV